jgi:hypothetical protein
MNEIVKEEVEEIVDGAEVVEEVVKEVVEPVISEAEKKASGNGWTDRDAWKESGGDPDDWVSAKKFNERGDMIGSIRSLEKRLSTKEKEFGDRLDASKKLHDIQMKVTVDDLKAKRDDAIDRADRDQANSFQDQIDEVNARPTDEPAPSGQNVLDDWNTANPWVMEDTPKAGYAMMRFNTHTSKGMTPGDAIAAMEAEVTREFPAVNERRENAPNVETNRSKPGKVADVKLSWSQLSNEELKWYNVMPTAWNSKEDYLKAVADERKGQ